MNTNHKTDVDEYVSLIDKTDFSKIACPQLPSFSNQQITKVLVSFFKDYLSDRSKKHSMVALAISSSSTHHQEIPLYPLCKLKKLGVLLSFVQEFDLKIYEIYLKRLSRREEYDQALFELQIGCMLKMKDPEIEFYELTNPNAEFPPDFHKSLDNGKVIWLEAYVREREKDFFDHFVLDDQGEVVPKPGEEIDDIKREYAKTTCKKIRNKRKNTISNDDAFITIVHLMDHYSAGSVAFQAFTNSLPRNDAVVICHTEFYPADRIVKERLRLYTNEKNQLDSNVMSYLNELFSTVGTHTTT